MFPNKGSWVSQVTQAPSQIAEVKVSVLNREGKKPSTEGFEQSAARSGVQAAQKALRGSAVSDKQRNGRY